MYEATSEEADSPSDIDHARQPTIALFDSGVGGLTVLAAIAQRRPWARYYYIADQAHVPYGHRPLQEIRGFAEGLTAHAFEQGADHVIMACNVSSATYEAEAQRLYGAQRVMGMVRLGAQAATAVTQTGRIGIFATQGTVNSEAYPKALYHQGHRAAVQVACPDFVPLIEAGNLTSADTERAVRAALVPIRREHIDTVILGCTHYPFLVPLIRTLAPEIQLIDPAQAVAEDLAGRIVGSGHRHISTENTQFRLATTGNLDHFRQQITQLYPWMVSQAETIYVPAETTSLRLKPF